MNTFVFRATQDDPRPALAVKKIIQWAATTPWQQSTLTHLLTSLDNKIQTLTHLLQPYPTTFTSHDLSSDLCHPVLHALVPKVNTLSSQIRLSVTFGDVDFNKASSLFECTRPSFLRELLCKGESKRRATGTTRARAQPPAGLPPIAIISRVVDKVLGNLQHLPDSWLDLTWCS